MSAGDERELVQERRRLFGVFLGQGPRRKTGTKGTFTWQAELEHRATAQEESLLDTD